MALPSYQPLRVYQGADWDYVVVWRDSEGVLVNLTGYSARMQVRRRPQDPALVELTTDPPYRIALGGVSGYLQLRLSASDTAVLPACSFEYPFVYDLELVDPGGHVTKLLRGPLANLSEATR